MTHTPLPWKFSPWHIEEGPPAVLAPAGHIVCTTAGDDDAAFIVKACNMHEPLVEIAIVLRQHLSLFCGPDDEIANQIFRIADETIAKAREATP
jgi:hypothetical protein